MFSQNGATVFVTATGTADYGNPDLVDDYIPGTDKQYFAGGIRKGDVNTVLLYVGAYWHRFIEPITMFWDKGQGKWVWQQWGFSLRAIRGNETATLVAEKTTNHASATAVDINSGLHPLGTRTLTAAQLLTLRTLAKALRGVVRFGAFYLGRKDEMHAEIQEFGALLAALADDIRRGRMDVNFPELVTMPDPKPVAPKPAPEPYVSKEDDEMVRFYKVADRWFVIDHAAGTVREIRDQGELNLMTNAAYGGIEPNDSHNGDTNLFALISQSLTSTKGPWRAA